MATKKQNRRHAVRRARRILNKAVDFVTKVSGRKLNAIRYGAGLGRSAVRDNSTSENGDAHT